MSTISQSSEAQPSEAQPHMTKGERTRARIVAAAERVFAELGFHDASIVKITEAAGVGQGTFYLYFASKIEVFDEVVEDLNRRVRHAMITASSLAVGRIEAERAGFRAFFQFTAEHPALYRIVRQAEFVSPGALRMHYPPVRRGSVARNFRRAHRPAVPRRSTAPIRRGCDPQSSCGSSKHRTRGRYPVGSVPRKSVRRGSVPGFTRLPSGPT